MAKVQTRTMMVKCVRKGYYMKERLPGQTFSFTGADCPSWCIELGAKGGPAKTSKDITPATAAAAYIKTLTSVDEIMEFCAGDERKGVVDAQASALEAIAKSVE